MPKLSLTDVVEIVSKSGTPKATKVASIKHRPAYDPAADFYKKLREGIVQAHKSGAEKDSLKTLMSTVVDPKKHSNYAAVVAGYLKWWGKKQISWFVPPAVSYASSGVEVSINPELGLEFSGQRHVIKLYLKAEALAKVRANLIVSLLNHCLLGSASAGTQFSILDVRAGKLFTFASATKNLVPMLDAELAYVASLWPHV